MKKLSQYYLKKACLEKYARGISHRKNRLFTYLIDMLHWQNDYRSAKCVYDKYRRWVFHVSTNLLSNKLFMVIIFIHNLQNKKSCKSSCVIWLKLMYLTISAKLYIPMITRQMQWGESPGELNRLALKFFCYVAIYHLMAINFRSKTSSQV